MPGGEIAIKGSGFFQVTMPDGTTGYTRDGSFQRDATGALVNNAGYTGSRAALLISRTTRYSSGYSTSLTGRA